MTISMDQESQSSARPRGCGRSLMAAFSSATCQARFCLQPLVGHLDNLPFAQPNVRDDQRGLDSSRLHPALAVVEYTILAVAVDHIILAVAGATSAMGYVDNYRWDVFVSFANNDNDAARPADRWVDRFVRDLRIGIKNWVGNADELNVFFEKDSIGGGLELEKLREYARSSVIFIAVISPSYVKRKWTLDELGAFSGSGNTSGRLFAIECRPVGDYTELPEKLRNISILPFFVQDPGERTPRPLSAEHDERAWKNRMEALTQDVGLLLQELKAGKSRRGGKAPARSTRTVLLAQTTDDMSDQCDDVRRYLTQAGYTVLPEQSYYPQGGEEFKAAFRADLEQADCYVQLLGQAKARRDLALPEGYTRFQFEAAIGVARAHSKLKTFIWRPANINITELKHDDAVLLREGTVIAMTLESLKKEVGSWMERLQSDDDGPPSAKNATVFINAAPNDQEIASAVSDECARQGFTAIMPSSENSALKLFKQVKVSLGTCKAYFLVFGQADEDWAVHQGMIFSKISAELSESDLPNVIAIIDGPPEEKNLPPIRLPRSSVINCRKSMDPVRQVLAGLRL
jgi:hypothetical protein